MTAPRAGRTMRLAGLLLVICTVPAARSGAQEADELVGYSAVATGTAFTVQPSVPALLPVEVPAEATLALATATLSSGGQGFGRASTFFPGTLIAGIRPLLEIGAGVELPIPDYPVVVESREFEPAKHNDQPGITMSTDVDPDRAIAIADAGGIGIPGIFGVHASRTVSTSVLKGTTVTATSTTKVEGVDLGLLEIDSIVSTATVTSDASTATCSGEVNVNGVTVNGQEATLDGEGLHLESEPLLPLGPVTDLVAELSETGVTVRLLGGADSCSGATGSRSSAGLLVSIPLPELGAIPPGGHLDLILASTSATAGASTLPPFAPPFTDLPPTLGDVVPRLPGPTFGGGPLDPVTLPPAAPTGPAPEAPGLPATQPIAYSFAGVPVPLIAGLFLLAFPAGVRVRRYMERILAIVAPT
jgi:hypothetical protein